MKIKLYIKGALKVIGILLAIPLCYFLSAFLFSYIAVGSYTPDSKGSHIYLNTNGVHLDLILPVQLMSEELKSGLRIKSTDRFISFGWGDKDFYLNTPEWKDLKFSTACSAMLLNSPSLMHVSRYKGKASDWAEIKLQTEQIEALNRYILDSFFLDESGHKSILPGKGYSWYDDFFEAKGSYSCIHTCNSWVNSGLKTIGAKACLWTPFDFVLMRMYEEKEE